MYDWRTAKWERTDMLVQHLKRGDVWLEGPDFDPTVELVGEASDREASMKNMVEFLINHPGRVGERVQREYLFGEVEQSLPSALEAMKKTGRRWVVILEASSDPKRYVQVLVTGSGSMWAECVSNEFLDDDERLDEVQCELLPALGWEWPGSPAFPNWHFHDELLDTGPAIAGLMNRTLRRVFGVDGGDKILVIMRQVAENMELVEQS